MSRHLAIDIGGSAARCYLGEFDGDSLSISLLHTIDNDPVPQSGKWYWNARGLFAGIKEAIAIAAGRYGDAIDSLGIDAMGNAFALLDAGGELLEPPVYTRGPQKEAVRERLHRLIAREDLYKIVGLEQTKLNSLYYLLEYQADAPDLLARARHFLMLPDLLCYWLTGEMASEYCIASTSYLFDAAMRDWSRPLIDLLGFDAAIFPPLSGAGTVLGGLRPELADELGLRRLRIVLPASHDTSSAIVCLPDRTADSAFISSGTWGMLGCKLDDPLLTVEAMQANFANEAAAFGRIQFTNNAPSLSILEKCMDDWAASGRGIGWDELFAQAEAAKPFGAIIDTNYFDFRAAGNVAERVRAYCRQTNQAVPEHKGEIARIVLESTILNYRRAMDSMVMLVGEEFPSLTLVGGGSRIPLLRQGIADALGREVTIGPVESTALGNLLAQLLGLGRIASIQEGWELLRGLFSSKTYPDAATGKWEEGMALCRALGLDQAFAER